MRRLLVQLDPDRLPSAFDRIVAYDAGAEDVLSYGGVSPGDVTSLVHGAIFTRGPKDLKHTALFLGGSSMHEAERLLGAVRRVFFGPFRVSVLFDPNGANTTAAAAVFKLVSALGGDVRGRRAVVLAGTGPVGARAAGLLLRLGSEVTITSRDAERGAKVAQQIGERFKGHVFHEAVRTSAEGAAILGRMELALGAGPSGVELVSQGGLAGKDGLKAIADVNAVPPHGVQGIEVTDDGVLREGVRVFGALAVGGLKMKAHKAALARLFERNDLVLDAEEIYDIAAAL
jgi:hypothetical protein